MYLEKKSHFNIYDFVVPPFPLCGMCGEKATARSMENRSEKDAAETTTAAAATSK